MGKITVVVADGHKPMREAIIFILENDSRFNPVAGCSTANELMEAVQKFQPDIVLLEVIIDTINCFEAIKKIHTLSPVTKIIGFSSHLQNGYVRRLIKYGGRGYITKSSCCEETIDGILEVYNGNLYICNEIKKNEDKYWKYVI